MTAIKTRPIRTAPGFAFPAYPVRALARAIAATWTVMKNRRRLRALGDLDDYLLADIGLTRADLRDAYAAPLLVDPSLRLAAVVDKQHRTVSENRPRGRRGDAALRSDDMPGPSPRYISGRCE